MTTTTDDHLYRVPFEMIRSMQALLLQLLVPTQGAGWTGTVEELLVVLTDRAGTSTNNLPKDSFDMAGALKSGRKFLRSRGWWIRSNNPGAPGDITAQSVITISPKPRGTAQEQERAELGTITPAERRLVRKPSRSFGGVTTTTRPPRPERCFG